MAPKSPARATSRYVTSDDFNVVAARVGENIARLLGVDDRRLKRWRAGRSRIPWAAYQLLYEHSSYAIAERDSTEHFARQMVLGERDALKRRVAELEEAIAHQSALVDWGCANDPLIFPSDARQGGQ